MAAYNIYNPQPPYTQQYMQPVQQAQPTPATPQPTSSINWCQGIAGAQAYPVLPGQSALLLDSEPQSNSFYIKTADASGMPMPLRIFDYKEREITETAEQSPTNTDKYDEAIKTIEERLDEIAAVQEKIIERLKDMKAKDTKETELKEPKEEKESKKRSETYDF